MKNLRKGLIIYLLKLDLKPSRKEKINVEIAHSNVAERRTSVSEVHRGTYLVEVSQT